MSDDKVKVGDTFLRLTGRGFRFDRGNGRVWSVFSAGGTKCQIVDSESVATVDALSLLDGANWRRVPPGYTVPPVAEWLSTTERLVEAYRVMMRDPETGAAGVDATVRQMAAMAGIEVGA